MIVGSCSSPQLSLCRGVLPWDLTATPIIPGISSPPDLDAIMPYFEMISSTGCSARIRQFLCSLLEPECRGVGYNILPPCRKACRGKVADMTIVAIISPYFQQINMILYYAYKYHKTCIIKFNYYSCLTISSLGICGNKMVV